MTVTNLGLSDAHDVVATESLPSSVTFDSTTGCAEDPAGVPGCSLGTVAAGSLKQYTVAVTVAPDAQGTITNTVTATASTPDPDTTSNNSASEDTEVLGRMDLSVTATDSSDPVEAGSSFHYQVTVANAGPQTARNVLLADTLPAELDADSITGCLSGDQTSCVVGDIASGASRQLQLNVTAHPDAWGLVTNHAEVSSDDVDLVPGNDAVDEETTILGVADVSVTKDDGVPSLDPGTAVTYTIAVSNAGPGTPATVDVTDHVPAELLGVTWSCVASAGAVCSPTGVDDLVDTIYLPPGETVTYSLDATVDSTLDPFLDLVTNTVTVAVPAEFVDHNSANDSATDTDSVGLFADAFESGDVTHWSVNVGLANALAQESNRSLEATPRAARQTTPQQGDDRARPID